MVELLLVTMVVAVLTAAVMVLLDPARGMFQLQPEMADVQQRVRVGLDSLQRDVLEAGAGMDWGAAAGWLLRSLPPIIPFRIGTTNSDQRKGVFYRPDVITVISVPFSAAQSRLKRSIADGASPVEVDATPGCPSGDPLCGFQAGQQAVVFDGRGRWDLFRITAADPSAGRLAHADDRLTNSYDTGAPLAEVVPRTYWLRRNGTAGSLYRYDGYKTESEITDRVVAFQIEYFGERTPPRLLSGFPEDDLHATYGPPPPPSGVDDPADTWPAGENCLFARDPESGSVESRLASLASTPDDNALAPLPAFMLADGPWCPDASTVSRFDADLLRIRRVRVTLRLTSPLGRLVPDREVRLDISPRNLILGR